MVQQLRHSFDMLERRVAQCTAHLEVANKEVKSFTYSVFYDRCAPLRYTGRFINMVQAKQKRLWSPVSNPLNSLAPLSAYITPMNSKALGLTWSTCAALSTGMATEYGREEKLARE